MWYRKAADQGNAQAQFNLGIMYHGGQGVAQDFKAAMVWYRKAADQGHAKAQCALGIMYADGHGVQQNLPTALIWVEKAAAQGQTNALEVVPKLKSMIAESAASSPESPPLARKLFRALAVQAAAPKAGRATQP